MKAKLRKITVVDENRNDSPYEQGNEKDDGKTKAFAVKIAGILKRPTNQLKSKAIGLCIVFILSVLVIFSGSSTVNSNDYIENDELQPKSIKPQYEAVLSKKIPTYGKKLKEGQSDTLLTGLKPLFPGKEEREEFESIRYKKSGKNKETEFSLELKVKKRRIQFEPTFSDKEKFFSTFRDFESLLAYFQWFAENNPDSVLIGSIGQSFEGRPIPAIRIGKNISPNKLPNIVIVGTEHGREWMVPNALAYAMTSILNLDSSSNSILNELNLKSSRILSNVNIWLLPILNPDGYVYTFLGNEHGSESAKQMRFWRKNRQMNEDRTVGIDLNRNWGSKGFTWGHGQTWTDSEVYMGNEPFSAVETKRILEWMFNPKQKDGRKISVSGFIAVHCCIGGILQPRNFCTIPTEIENAHERLGRVMCKEMNKVGHGSYSFKKRRKTQEISSSGISIDWAYYDAKIPYPLMIETSIRKSDVEEPKDAPMDDGTSVAKQRKERLRAKMSSDQGDDVPFVGKELSRATLLHAAFVGGVIEFENQNANVVDNDKLPAVIKSFPWGFKGNMFTCKQPGKPDLIPADLCAKDSKKPWIECKKKNSKRKAPKNRQAGKF